MSKKLKVPGWPDAFTPSLPAMPRPLADNPLTQSITGGFDFVKNLWGGMPSSIPGLVMPTLDVEELDKRIKDLKAVESWLEVNANMLRATIQALEVQRNTVATLKSFGGSFGEGASELLKNMGSLSRSPGGAPSAEPPAPVSAAPVRRPRSRKRPASASKPAAPGIGGGAWLDFLQNQFNQVALAALATPEPSSPSKKVAAAGGTRAKPRVRSPRRRP